jgi:hypothetical protein
MCGGLLDAPELAEAVALARRAATAARPTAGPLYAAHADLDWPESLPLQLFHAITLLREYRGRRPHRRPRRRGASPGSSRPSCTSRRATRGRASRCASAAAGRPSSGTPRRAAARRGLARRVERFTEQGAAARRTSRRGPTRWRCPAWERLGEEDCARLRALVRPLSTAIVAAGGIGIK